MENSKEVKVESVKAINKTTVEVTFDNAVTALEKGDITVTNEKTGDKQYIKAVKLSDDKKSATIEFYDALADKSTYKVAVKDAGEATLEFAVGAAAKIEAKTTQTVVPAVNKVDLKKLDYKVLDANGLDITADTKVAFETTADINGTTITLADGKSAFVYITTEVDGKKIKSERITVKAEASSIKKITDITVTAEKQVKAKETFEAKDYKQNLVIQKGTAAAYVNVAGEDQYGKADYPEVANIKFESLDNEIGLVDVKTGKVTAFKEGVLPIKVTVGELTKTVEVKVVADAKATALKVAEEAITLSNKVEAGKTVEIELLDQYENVFETGAKTAKVKVISGEKLVTVAETLTFVNGKAELEVKPAKDAKAGEAVIEIDYDGIKETVKVTVTEAGAVDNYKVEGFKAELDKNADNKAKTPTTMTLSVLPVDEKGVVTGNAVDNAAYEVKDAEGKVAKGITVENGALKLAETAKVGEYTLITKVGTLEVSTQTFKVVDTSPQPTLAVKKSNFEVAAEGEVELNDVFEITYNDAVVADDKVAFANIKFTSSNSAVAESATDAANIKVTAEEGEATVVLHSATITIDGKEFKDFDLKNVQVKVKVAKAEEGGEDAEQAAVDAEAKKITADKFTSLTDGNNVLTTAQDLVTSGYTVEITKSGNTAIAKTGDITQPNSGEAAAQGEVTFTVTKAGKTATATVDLTVNAK